jgi:ABC-type antimicrobial peptide transport system permease subunit
MAAIGLYGLISYSVAQRTREIGIRLALGAGPVGVLRLLLREGGILALSGAGLGLLGSLVTGRLLRGQLVGVGELDPVVLGGTVLLLASVALIATLIPARRATRTDPLRALREC